MIRIRTLLAAAALAFLPALASARVGDLAIRCDSSPTGYVTRSQLESGSALGVRCQQEIDRAPICNEDNTHCACPNEGTAKDFVTCAWDLIAACEGQARPRAGTPPPEPVVVRARRHRRRRDRSRPLSVGNAAVVR